MLDDAHKRQAADQLADLMKHLVKGFLADRGLSAEANIGLRAAMITALAIVGERGVAGETAIALITCTAEGIALGQ